MHSCITTHVNTMPDDITNQVSGDVKDISRSSWKDPGDELCIIHGNKGNNSKSCDQDEMDTDLAKSTLEKSYEDLADRCNAMLQTVHEQSNSKKTSLLLESCRESLASDLAVLLDESRQMLHQMDATSNSIKFTAWRVSVTHVAAVLLLDTVQAALLHPQRSVLEIKLQSMVDCISSQIQGNSDGAGSNNQECKQNETLTRDVGFSISPRMMPCLAFDVMIGNPVRYTLLEEDDDLLLDRLPLKVKLQPVVEILAQDLVQGSSGMPPKARHACRVEIETCQHSRVYSGGGIVGMGFLQLAISNVINSDSNNHSVRVREARCLQRNAFPPRPKTSVDIYSSSTQGSSNVTLTFNFQTFATLHDEAPDLYIDLIMGSE